MSDKSKIEWLAGGASWNPIIAVNKETGKRGWFCTHVSEGCRNCYAERRNRWLGNGLPYAPASLPKLELQLAPEKLLLQPRRWKRPRRIFVCSMTDLFHPEIPDAWIRVIFRLMQDAPQHIFLLLTKRPERMKLWESLGHASMSHVWPGVSIEDQKTADERIPLLLKTSAAVRWVSYEPALGPVNWNRDWFTWPPKPGNYPGTLMNPKPGIDWIVAGGESGPRARPAHPDWFRAVRDQCQRSDVPFFFKQWGEWVSVSEVEGSGRHHYFADGATVRRVGKKQAGRLLDGREWNEFPEVRCAG